MRWTTPLLLLLLGLVAGVLATREPAPAPANAAPGVFSAGRALADVRAIAQRPHPIGSAESLRVQAYLTKRMAGLGLAPQARPFPSPRGEGRNLLGVLPGADRQAPAVLLMAHFDSVPAGPGAADDAAGVAAVLETARALASAPRQRDVMVLLTDGEEAGLLGSKAFFTADPARAHAGVVINLEARGNRGRAVMFETHQNAAPLVRALVDSDSLAAASSLMPDLYRRLPNDTDLTEAIRAGHDGLNFAFFAGLDAYHRPPDTAQALDPGSLQHIGEQTLRAARALTSVAIGPAHPGAPAPPLPGRAPDQAYADILGGPVLQYPAVVGWALVVLAGGGLAAYALRLAGRGRLSLAGVAAGALAFLGLVLVLALGLQALGMARDALAGRHLGPLLRNAAGARAGAALLATGLALVWAAMAGRRLRAESLAFGALAVLAAVAVALQALAKLDAFIVTWPFIGVGLALTLGGPDRPWVRAVILLAILSEILYWALLLFDLVGQTMPAALAPFAALAVAALLPVAPRAGARAATAGAALAAAGAGISLLALGG
ncbi:MAG: M20/M25/M40 family metallo-hydrolase [Caulobacteraceae bacterium]